MQMDDLLCFVQNPAFPWRSLGKYRLRIAFKYSFIPPRVISPSGSINYEATIPSPVTLFMSQSAGRRHPTRVWYNRYGTPYRWPAGCGPPLHETARSPIASR